MPRPAQAERNNRILEMYNQGMKQTEIAEKMELTVTTISVILRSMPGYKRRGTDKAGRESIKAEAEDREAKEELRYLYMLEHFAKEVVRVNKLAADGIPVAVLKERMAQLAKAFTELRED